MANHIKAIKIKDRPPLPDFEWPDIPQLCVISGLNGSGKTKFLEAINGKILEPTMHSNIEIPGAPNKDAFGYVPWRASLGNIGSVSSFQCSQEMQSFAKLLKNRSARNEAQERLYQSMRKRFGTTDILGHPDSFYSTEEFSEAFLNSWIYKENTVTHSHIAKLFNSYLFKTKKFQDDNRNGGLGHGPTDVEIEEKFGEAPWDKINRLFDRYKFSYKVNYPTSLFSIQYNVQFCAIDNQNIRIDFESLSSGEQMIVSLILWSFDENFAEQKTVLLLDEPDAHLHPEMARQFKEIVSDTLVKEMGMQVIMTTHSPTTLCWMEEGSIFLMDKDKGIIPATKSAAMEKLTSGLLLVRPKIRIVLVEDKDDELFYQMVYETLVSNKYIENKVQLVFRSVNTSVDESGGKSRVKKACTQWLEYSRSAGIEDLIYGLVDKDADDNNTLPKNVLHLERYCHENYLADPLLMFALLVDEDNETAVSLGGAVGYHKGDTLSLKRGEVQDIQKICDQLLAPIIKTLNGKPHNIVVKKNIDYVNNRQIEVPAFIFESSGKDVLELYKDAYQNLSVRNLNKLREFIEKTHLVPMDLVDTIQNLMSDNIEFEREAERKAA